MLLAILWLVGFGSDWWYWRFAAEKGLRTALLVRFLADELYVVLTDFGVSVE